MTRDRTQCTRHVWLIFQYLKSVFWEKKLCISGFSFLTGLQNLVKLPGSTRWARLAVNTLRVEAVQLNMHQQQLHHFGHGVCFAGEDTHLHPKVKGAWHAVILQQRQDRHTWDIYGHGVVRYQRAYFRLIQLKYLREYFEMSLLTCLAHRVEQSVMILLRHFLWHINLQAKITNKRKRRIKFLCVFLWNAVTFCGLSALSTHHCTCRLSPFPRCRSHTGHMTAWCSPGMCWTGDPEDCWAVQREDVQTVYEDVIIGLILLKTQNLRENIQLTHLSFFLLFFPDLTAWEKPEERDMKEQHNSFYSQSSSEAFDWNKVLTLTLVGSDSICFIWPLMKMSSTDWNKLTTSETSVFFLDPASEVTLLWYPFIRSL